MSLRIMSSDPSEAAANGNEPAVEPAVLDEATRHLWMGQCNCAYWHGVFGGLYLGHLRDSLWKKIAEAEGLLRRGEGLVSEPKDLDLDGNGCIDADEFAKHQAAHHGKRHGASRDAE